MQQLTTRSGVNIDNGDKRSRTQASKMLKSSLVIVALVALGTVAALDSSLMVGGLGEERPANDEVRNIVSSVRKHMETKYPAEFTAIEPVSYKTQVVAGLNYFVKAFVTEKESNRKRMVHMRIYRPIRGDTQLTAIKMNVDENTPLRHFQ